jgi:hypothetical protein
MLIVVWTICHGAIFKDFMRSQENYNLEITTSIKLFVKFIKFIIPCQPMKKLARKVYKLKAKMYTIAIGFVLAYLARKCN